MKDKSASRPTPRPRNKADTVARTFGGYLGKGIQAIKENKGKKQAMLDELMNDG